MTIHLDTSALIEIATKTRQLLPAVRAAVGRGHRIGSSAVAMYEWLRGLRVEAELELQRELCPPEQIVVFGPAEAARAAELYRQLTRPRGRDMDIAIAACAIEHGATLWTVNPRDFRDIAGLKLYESRG